MTKKSTPPSLFPELPPAERQKADSEFDRYLRFILRMHKNLRSDPERYERFRDLLTKRGRSLR